MRKDDAIMQALRPRGMQAMQAMQLLLVLALTAGVSAQQTAAQQAPTSQTTAPTSQATAPTSRTPATANPTTAPPHPPPTPDDRARPAECRTVAEPKRRRNRCGPPADDGATGHHEAPPRPERKRVGVQSRQLQRGTREPVSDPPRR